VRRERGVWWEVNAHLHVWWWRGCGGVPPAQVTKLVEGLTSQVASLSRSFDELLQRMEATVSARACVCVEVRTGGGGGGSTICFWVL
jgi:hypothetical protein